MVVTLENHIKSWHLHFNECNDSTLHRINIWNADLGPTNLPHYILPWKTFLYYVIINNIYKHVIICMPPLSNPSHSVAHRWKTLPLPLGGVRTGLHPALQPAAAPEEPRRSGGAGQEQAVPLHHLRQGVRHRVQSEDAHYEGKFNRR